MLCVAFAQIQKYIHKTHTKEKDYPHPKIKNKISHTLRTHLRTIHPHHSKTQNTKLY